MFLTRASLPLVPNQPGCLTALHFPLVVCVSSDSRPGSGEVGVKGGAVGEHRCCPKVAVSGLTSTNICPRGAYDYVRGSNIRTYLCPTGRLAEIETPFDREVAQRLTQPTIRSHIYPFNREIRLEAHTTIRSYICPFDLRSRPEAHTITKRPSCHYTDLRIGRAIIWGVVGHHDPSNNHSCSVLRLKVVHPTHLEPPC